MVNHPSHAEKVPPLPGSHVHVVLLCQHEELGRAFLAGLCPRATGGEGEVEIEGRRVRLRVLAGDPRTVPGWVEAVSQAHAHALLARFLDLVSLDQLRTLYRQLPAGTNIPLAIFLVREEGELDFKISCPTCGQKLWVRDTDGGRKGRCPNCDKPFRLPSQAAYLRAQLPVPDSVATLTVILGRATACRGALARLLAPFGQALMGAASLDQETVKKSTVPVVLPESDATAHD